MLVLTSPAASPVRTSAPVRVFERSAQSLYSDWSRCGDTDLWLLANLQLEPLILQVWCPISGLPQASLELGASSTAAAYHIIYNGRSEKHSIIWQNGFTRRDYLLMFKEEQDCRAIWHHLSSELKRGAATPPGLTVTSAPGRDVRYSGETTDPKELALAERGDDGYFRAWWLHGTCKCDGCQSCGMGGAGVMSVHLPSLEEYGPSRVVRRLRWGREAAAAGAPAGVES